MVIVMVMVVVVVMRKRSTFFLVLVLSTSFAGKSHSSCVLTIWASRSTLRMLGGSRKGYGQ